MPTSSTPIRDEGARLAIWSTVATFATYFCMYAFRKPFTVGAYADLELWGIDYKIVLIITQLLGYTISKFSGIKIISEMTPGRRIVAIAVLIAIAESALLLFGLIPAPFNFVCLFFNGLPLGLVWGIVFSFLEGRRATEMLGAGLCCSFILASGAVQSVGAWLMSDVGVAEFWMPAATGGVFVVPLAISLWMLARVPPPSAADMDRRSRRDTMDRSQRRAFSADIALGLVLLIGVYTVLNAYRDFRSNFARELWAGLGYADTPSIFALSEIPIAAVVLVSAAFMVLVRDNTRAFRISLGSIMVGCAIVAASTFGFTHGTVGPVAWIILVGVGMYVPYIAFHVMVFERLIAALGRRANVGYLMYLGDAFGYLASVAVILYKNFGAPDLDWVAFFVGASYVTAGVSAALGIGALAFFRNRIRIAP
jgi:MFS family permease